MYIQIQYIKLCNKYNLLHETIAEYLNTVHYTSPQMAATSLNSLCCEQPGLCILELILSV